MSVAPPDKPTADALNDALTPGDVEGAERVARAYIAEVGDLPEAVCQHGCMTSDQKRP